MKLSVQAVQQDSDVKYAASICSDEAGAQAAGMQQPLPHVSCGVMKLSVETVQQDSDVKYAARIAQMKQERKHQVRGTPNHASCGVMKLCVETVARLIFRHLSLCI